MDFDGTTLPEPATARPENGLSLQDQFQQMADEITLMAGHMNAMEYRFIHLLSDFDKVEAWVGDGIRSFAHWLNFQCGITSVVAREKVRVARALPALPLIDEAFRTGRISYSKVRAMTRVATPENEECLLDIALYGTAAHVERAVRYYKYVREEAWHGEFDYKTTPRISCIDDELGMCHLHITVPSEDGELIMQALERMLRCLQDEARQKQQEQQEAESKEAETKERGLQDKMFQRKLFPRMKTGVKTAKSTGQWH